MKQEIHRETHVNQQWHQRRFAASFFSEKCFRRTDRRFAGGRRDDFAVVGEGNGAS
jgi:hypothetical protein